MIGFDQLNENVSQTVYTSLAYTLVILVVGLALNLLIRLSVRRSSLEGRQAYLVRKVASFAIFGLGGITVVVIWLQEFGPQFGLIVGLVTAGVAFASQEAIGALFGWVNIIAGGIYSVGDRVELGGVRGTVVDISPMRTQLLEAGDEQEATSWITGRQFTGRLVSVSNKETFTTPVYNYSRWFSYIWEEFMVVVPYRDDWRRGRELLEQVVLDNVGEHVESGRRALEALQHRFAMDNIRTEPETFMELGDSGIELSSRYMIPLIGARRVKSSMADDLMTAFEAEGITVAFPTSEVGLTGTLPLEVRNVPIP